MSNVFTFSGGDLKEGITFPKPKEGGRAAIKVGSRSSPQEIFVSDDVNCEPCDASEKLVLKSGFFKEVSGVPHFVPAQDQPEPHQYLLVQTLYTKGFTTDGKLARRSGTWMPLGVSNRTQSSVKELLRHKGGEGSAPEFLLRLHDGDQITIRPFGVSPNDLSNTYVISCYRKDDGKSLALSCEDMLSVRKRQIQQN